MNYYFLVLIEPKRVMGVGGGGGSGLPLFFRSRHFNIGPPHFLGGVINGNENSEKQQ